MKDVLWQGRSANVENMLIERVCRTCPVSRLRSASPRTSVARVASFCTTIVTSIEIVAAPKKASNSNGIKIALRFHPARPAPHPVRDELLRAVLAVVFFCNMYVVAAS